MNPLRRNTKALFRYASMYLLLMAITAAHALAQSTVAAGYTFTASSGTFNYLGGGNRITAIETDDAYASIPIGFTFTFCGVEYTDVTVCSNGWLVFGTTVGSSPNWNYNAYTGGDGIAPAVFALYEDISGLGSGISHYDVSGSPGSQIFTWECRDWKWDFDAPTASVSFQVKLYEASGVVEVQYKQEPGAVVLNLSGGATIGIANSTSDWQVLNGVGTSPASSSSTWTSSLSSVPASGQRYIWDPGPACPTVAPVTVTAFGSTTAMFNWTAMAGIGYEYAVDLNNAAAPLPATTKISTTATSATVSGLTPSTIYYIHVRNKCGANNYSKWEMVSVETRPPCSNPKPIVVTRVDSNSVDFQWPAVGSALTYQYIVDNSPNTPTSAAAATSQTTVFVNLTGLTEGEMYYVHYRSLCAGNDSSGWSLDSFRIPVPCRRPNLQIATITPNDVVVYWNPVKTAANYEYYMGTQTTPPAVGTPIQANTLQTPYLSSATRYNLFVKCNCNDRGVKTSSDWERLEFMTPFPLGIQNANATGVALTAFPNPVADVLHLAISGTTAKNARVQIMDVAGKVWLNQVVSGSMADINMKGLPAGVLTLQYTDDDNNRVIKIVKQ